jgi:hypothetical protein
MRKQVGLCQIKLCAAEQHTLHSNREQLNAPYLIQIN